MQESSSLPSVQSCTPLQRSVARTHCPLSHPNSHTPVCGVTPAATQECWSDLPLNCSGQDNGLRFQLLLKAYISTRVLKAYISTRFLKAYISTRFLKAYISTRFLKAYISTRFLKAYISTRFLKAYISTRFLGFSVHIW